MNITFLLGNGFDLNLGLKTQYKDFLKWYLTQPCADKDIESFKAMIQGDIETWSDLERTLGEKTNEVPLSDADVFVKCKMDIDRALHTYLSEQNREYEIAGSMDDAVKIFSDSLLNAHKHTKQRTQNKIIGLFNTYSTENRVYNIIDFNYTDYVDKLYNSLKPTIASRDFNSRTRNDNKGQLVHLHGTTNYSMIVGVNDPKQLANESFRTNSRVLDCVIKPQMNYASEDLKDDLAKSILDGTSIFYVFGMSIGVTDKLWWVKIKNVLLNRIDAMLIIFDYNPEYNSLFPYTEKGLSDAVVERFFKVAEATEDERKKIEQRIGVKFNTSMINLSAAKKEPATT